MKSFGPESEFLHRLKGKDVTIERHGGDILDGKLVWVDRYSLGLMRKATARRAEHEVMVFKSGIATIERREYESQLGDENERPTASTSA